jgi:hypothetical protein
VILPLKTLPPLPSRLVRFYLISGTPSGWITEDIFHQWVVNVFIPYVHNKRAHSNLINRRALLILDGHSSRSVETCRLLEEEKVDVAVIPAHSSSILQPLDLEPFSVFKSALRKRFEVKANEPLPKMRIRLLRDAAICLDTALTYNNIDVGFSRSGFWPFSKGAPLDSTLVTSNFHLLPLEPPKKKTRRPRISGTIFTCGAPFPALPPTSNRFQIEDVTPSSTHSGEIVKKV